LQVKFNKSDINGIYDLLRERKSGRSVKKLNVPSEESFAYILKKAQSGNEMAAFQLSEWLTFCKPSSTDEQKVISNIKKAAEKIFEL
jgi:hypothetical protein